MPWKDPLKKREYQQAYYERNRLELLAKKKDARERHPEVFRLAHRNYNIKVRRTVIKHYGGKCACCGETTLEFLSIDHVNGGGNEHRRMMGIEGGNPFYAWLIANEFPEGFQVLCHNCNMAKGFYGVCPHQKKTP